MSARVVTKLSAPSRAPNAVHGEAVARLLAELADSEAVSGNVLANRLGVGRAAVWKQIEALRELGLPIGAQAGSGYRLEAPLELLDATQIINRLTAAQQARLGGLDVHWRIDSTSSELLRRASDAAQDLRVCAAEIQTDGRGRRGRTWQMPLGGGIALSLLKRFDNGMAPLAGLSLVAGLAAVRALADSGVHGIGLKWPNDLVVGERKLGGILVELGGDAIGPCYAVIGIGLNARLAAGSAIDQPWTDLATLAGAAAPSRNQVFACVIARLIEALDRFSADGFAAFADDYARFDVLRGRRVHVLHGGLRNEGIARGVDARGALRVALRVAFADGERCFDSAEVSVRGAP